LSLFASRPPPTATLFPYTTLFRSQLHLLLRPAGELEVAQGLLIHREDPHGGAVLGRHVADGRAVGEGQGGDPGTVELDELSDHSDRKSTRLNSSHGSISYAVFCLK